MNTFTRYVNDKQLVSIFAFGCEDGMAQLSSLSCKQNTLELPVQMINLLSCCFRGATIAMAFIHGFEWQMQYVHIFMEPNSYFVGRDLSDELQPQKDAQCNAPLPDKGVQR